MKAYIGGHSVELTPSGGSVSVQVNGASVTLEDDKEYEHNEGGQEIFK